MLFRSWQAILISFGSLVAGWLIYDGLCRTPQGRHTGGLAIAVFLLSLAAAYGYTHVFSGRGAFINAGAFIGTLMAANVFAVIIPNQRKITAALLKGETPDPRLGAIGKQRSLHNTYLTLPVLLMMVSNHFPMLTGTAQGWLVVAMIVIAGALLRHFLVRTEVGDAHGDIAWMLPVIGMALALALMLTMPAALPVFTGKVSDADAVAVVQTRCAACHAANPTEPTIKAAPKGIMLENLDELRRYAAQVETQAVKNHAMPLGNRTHMTDAERAQLGAWIAAQ